MRYPGAPWLVIGRAGEGAADCGLDDRSKYALPGGFTTDGIARVTSATNSSGATTLLGIMCIDCLCCRPPMGDDGALGAADLYPPPNSWLARTPATCCCHV